MKRIIDWAQKHRIAALIGFLFTVLSLGTAGTETTRINIRFALMTEEMSGHALGLFPTINGHPYPDYPSLYNFLSYLTSCMGCWLNHWTLTLPTILLGCYVVAMTAAVGERLRRGIGFHAALFSLLSYEYINIFTAFSIDVPVAAAAVTIVWFLLKHDFGWRALPPYAARLALAFIVRGPLGIIMCGAVTASVLLGNRRWKMLPIYGVVGAAVAAALLALAYQAILRQGGEELWHEVRRWQVDSRLASGRPFYHYLLSTVISFLPLTGFVIAALALKRRELLKPENAMTILWALVPIALLSIPSCRHLRYLTPVLPAFALLAALGYADADGSVPGRILDGGVKVADKLALPAGILFIATAAVVSCFMPTRLEMLLPHLVIALLLLAAIGRRLRRFTGRTWTLVRPALSFAVLIGIVMTAADAMWECSSIFVRRVEEKRRGRLFLYLMSPDHDALKVMYNLPPERRREVISLYPVSRKRPPKLLDRMYPCRRPAEALPEIRPEDVVVLNYGRLKNLIKDAAAAGMTVVKIDEGRLGHRKSLAVKLLPSQDKKSSK